MTREEAEKYEDCFAVANRYAGEKVNVGQRLTWNPKLSEQDVKEIILDSQDDYRGIFDSFLAGVAHARKQQSQAMPQEPSKTEKRVMWAPVTFESNKFLLQDWLYETREEALKHAFDCTLGTVRVEVEIDPSKEAV